MFYVVDGDPATYVVNDNSVQPFIVEVMLQQRTRVDAFRMIPYVAVPGRCTRARDGLPAAVALHFAPEPGSGCGV